MAVDTRTAGRNFNSGGGWGGAGAGALKTSAGDTGLFGRVRRGGVGGGFRGHPPQKSLKCRGSEMVFSTFTMRYFSKINSTCIGCKMMTAYSMYLVLNQKHFSSRKVEVLAPYYPPPPPRLRRP